MFAESRPITCPTRLIMTNTTSGRKDGRSGEPAQDAVGFGPDMMSVGPAPDAGTATGPGGPLADTEAGVSVFVLSEPRRIA